MRRFAVVVALVLVTAVAPFGGARAGEPVVLTKHREYGDGIVRVPRSVDRARIVFHGRAGDRVLLRGTSCGLSLQTADGEKVAREAVDFWRLPERTTYVFAFHLCQHQRDVYVQLAKLVVRRLPVDGPPVRLRPRRGFIKAVAVRVPARGRVQVTPDRFGGSEWPDLLFSDGTRSFRGNRTKTAADVSFEAGSPALTQEGPVSGEDSHPLDAGERVLLLVRRATTLTATRTAESDVSVDGPAVTVSNVGRPYQETALSFDGSAGQWVHLEQDGQLIGPGNRYRYHSLIGPDGGVIRRAVDATYPFWQLPVTGRYRLLVETGAAAVTAQVRVRTVRVVGEMPADGTPLAFTTASPGEWMLATLHSQVEGERHLRIVGSDSTAAWTAYAELAARRICALDEADVCGDYEHVEVDPAHQFYSQFFLGAQPWTVLLAMPFGATGSVSLAVPFDQPARTPINRGTALPRL